MKTACIAVAALTLAGAVLADEVAPGFAGRTAENRAKIMAQIDAQTLDPYDLLQDVSLKKYKAMAKDLVFGKNVESKFSALIAASKKQTPEGQEAAFILKALKDAQARISARIKKEIDLRPSQALEDIDLFAKTWPTHAGDFAEAKKQLSAIPEIGKLRAANKVYHKNKDNPPRNKGAARTVRAQCEGQKKSLAPLLESENKSVVEEAKALVKGFDSQIEWCDELSQAKK